MRVGCWLLFLRNTVPMFCVLHSPHRPPGCPSFVPSPICSGSTVLRTIYSLQLRLERWYECYLCIGNLQNTSTGTSQSSIIHDLHKSYQCPYGINMTINHTYHNLLLGLQSHYGSTRLIKYSSITWGFWPSWLSSSFTPLSHAFCNRIVKSGDTITFCEMIAKSLWKHSV